ncbi:MAG: hypothetical protein ACI8W8_004260, partial [Rhodothermales bacterium]
MIRLFGLALMTGFLITITGWASENIGLEQAHDTMDRNVEKLQERVDSLRNSYTAVVAQEKDAFMASLDASANPEATALQLKKARGDVESVSHALESAEEQLEQAIGHRNILKRRIRTDVADDRQSAHEVLAAESARSEAAEELRRQEEEQRRLKDAENALQGEASTRQAARDEAWRAVLAATLANPREEAIEPAMPVGSSLLTEQNERNDALHQAARDAAETAARNDLDAMEDNQLRQAAQAEARNLAEDMRRQEDLNARSARVAAREKYLREFQAMEVDARRDALKDMARSQQLAVDPLGTKLLDEENHRADLRVNAVDALTTDDPDLHPVTTIGPPPKGPAFPTEIKTAFHSFTVVRMKGICRVMATGEFIPLELNQEYPLGTIIRTGVHSFADVEFTKLNTFRILPRTTLEITEDARSSPRKVLSLHSGSVRVEMDKLPAGHKVEVETPSMICSAEGTRFTVSYNDEDLEVPRRFRGLSGVHHFVCDSGRIQIASRHARDDGRVYVGRSLVLSATPGTELWAALLDGIDSYYAKVYVQRGQISGKHGDAISFNVNADEMPTEFETGMTLEEDLLPVIAFDVSEGYADFVFRNEQLPNARLERRAGTVFVTPYGFENSYKSSSLLSNSLRGGREYEKLRMMRAQGGDVSERAMRSQVAAVEKTGARMADLREDIVKIMGKSDSYAVSIGDGVAPSDIPSKWGKRNADEQKLHEARLAEEAEREAELMAKQEEMENAARRHEALVAEADRQRRLDEAKELAMMERKLQMIAFEKDRVRYMRRYQDSMERERERFERKAAYARQSMGKLLETVESRERQKAEKSLIEREVDIEKLRAMEASARKRVAAESVNKDMLERETILKSELSRVEEQRVLVKTERTAAIADQEAMRRKYEIEREKYLSRVAKEREKDELRVRRQQDKELQQFQADEER